ncbi:uncharacterized protein LOC108621936 [Ceratina calcarata]|uniref:Uncharacterized protein LOC108621936 n=1 Tax=Ceratina calcarata TaxID=156304 RepID=A0AAJ7W8E2_9HYME|nr:uncharacterized protein LOC108621936 [Ceratina calcarata]
MSVYSTDSLEDINAVSPRDQSSLHRNNEYTGSNKTTPNAGTDKDAKIAKTRNAIIASRGFADVPKRRRPASSRNGKRDVTARLKGNNADNSTQDETISKRFSARCSKRFSKAFATKRSSMDSPMSMKPDKKLGNVLPPKIQPARKPRSYLGLYRRRFSELQYNARSPKGSTLSVCGDSEREQLSDDDARTLATPRDDQSELSFYRRIIEGTVDPLASLTETVRRQGLRDLDTSSSRAKQDDKSKKSLGYRPYTIEEYKTLSIPKLDRSLGPDTVEMQAKREWLMRRRSYGNSVSARNRQRILLQAHKLKSEDDIVEKCFLPPLKDQEVDAKAQDQCLKIPEDREIIQTTSNVKNRRYVKRNCDKTSSRRPKKFERTSSFSSLLDSNDVVEDSYLESLRQRHLHEKQMIDRIIHEALCP